MSSAPGADELRMRAVLIRQGVGPDAHPVPPVPPQVAAVANWRTLAFDTRLLTRVVAVIVVVLAVQMWWYL